jgi:hypothetical protein
MSRTMTEPPLDPSSNGQPSGTGTPAPQASLRQVIGAVFWSFFGVRKGKAMQRDALHIKPAQVIVVGLVFALLFVLSLLLLVRIILHFAT